LSYMSRTQEHKKLFRERITIIMVLFFCFLISSSEYIIQDERATVKKEQQSHQDESPAPGETFVGAAVDAVVPFVFAAVGQVVNLIYEIEEFEPIASSGIVTIKYSSDFFEILLEKIISNNAP
jgi:hypothetical protein